MLTPSGLETFVSVTNEKRSDILYTDSKNSQSSHGQTAANGPGISMGLSHLDSQTVLHSCPYGKNWFVIFMQCIHCISFDTTRWQQTQFIFTGVCLTLLLPTTAPFHLLGMTYSETSSEKLLIRCYGELYFVGRVITLCSFTIRWKHCNQGYTTRSNRNIFHNNSKNWPPTEEKCVYFAPNVWHV